jgi:hypothetical protein
MYLHKKIAYLVTIVYPLYVSLMPLRSGSSHNRHLDTDGSKLEVIKMAWSVVAKCSY